MSGSFAVSAFAFANPLSVAALGYISAVATQKRLHSNKRESTLAADAPGTLPPGVRPADTRADLPGPAARPPITMNGV